MRHMGLWNDTIDQRGGQEIFSCLDRNLNNISPRTTEIIMCSDCCPGQNRKKIFSVVFYCCCEF